QKAIISLKNDRGTNYKAYLAVYNALHAAYEELWEASSQAQFGKSYEELPVEQKRSIRVAIPLIISEAEPTAF
ncbi:MAG: biopolymer transporter ExbD, partial [Phaeodactylibacter sp.]|nr:biopolymer transporter ExbD [Phaeodactylibacter sp.]